MLLSLGAAAFTPGVPIRPTHAIVARPAVSMTASGMESPFDFGKMFEGMTAGIHELFGQDKVSMKAP